MNHVTVLFPEEGESWAGLLKRVVKTEGQVLLILSLVEDRLLREEAARRHLLESLKRDSAKILIGARNRVLVAAARSSGLRVIDKANDLKHLLKDHPQYNEAVRAFSPHIWQQQLRSQLQSMGLLSLPKLRIWGLIGISTILFLFVVLKLLPSATIRIAPRQEAVMQTSNIFLVQSGSTVQLPDRVRTMELKPLRVRIDKTLTFDDISKEFIGKSASVQMTIVNKAEESYSLRRDTRMVNQAGMVFRLQEGITVEPGKEVTVLAQADDTDQYHEIIGERGNVPANVRWEFPGLSQFERKLVYGENRVAATGGTNDFRTVLQQKDLDLAEKQLKSELLAQANQLIDEEIVLYNQEHPDEVVTRLYYDELTQHEFVDIVLPSQFIGEEVTSVPVQGSLLFTAYAYDAQEILDRLSDELADHVEQDKRLVADSATLQRLVVHVIDYADDLQWIKLTVDLTGTEQALLDPLSPTGAHFASSVRELVLGKTKAEAIRILKNLPEVEKADVRIWPPWQRVLPTIPYHIYIEQLEK